MSNIDTFYKIFFDYSHFAKEEGDFDFFSPKARIFDGMGVHKCIQYGSLHVLEGTLNAEMYIKILEQRMHPSR